MLLCGFLFLLYIVFNFRRKKVCSVSQVHKFVSELLNLPRSSNMYLGVSPNLCKIRAFEEELDNVLLRSNISFICFDDAPFL